ncbi:MAG: hypothetical protein M3P11_01470 [Actinomycetota bacterium]|nr:hypothetical protein [Actinomycetota bacterium]
MSDVSIVKLLLEEIDMTASVAERAVLEGCHWPPVCRDERPCGVALRGTKMTNMFARYFVELPMDAESVEGALLRDPLTWVPGLAVEANSHGDSLLAAVGFGDEVRVARTVEIEFGEAVRIPSKTVLPLRWTATGVSGLFPSLDADLEIAPLGAHTTQLAMSARYVPPLGVLGRAIDRTLLYRVAEATLKDFLDRVAVAIRSELAPGGAVPAGA